MKIDILCLKKVFLLIKKACFYICATILLFKNQNALFLKT